MAARHRWCAALCLSVLLLEACNAAAQTTTTCKLLLKSSNSSTTITAGLSCTSDSPTTAPTVAVNGSLISAAQLRQFKGVNVVDIEDCTERWTAQADRPVQAVLAFCGEDTVQLVQPRIQG
jgi:hypothetical protein